MSNELTVQKPAEKPILLRPLVQPSELVEAHKEVTKLIANALERDRDFGVIPGTRGKPTLLKPGAERLLKAFGCHAEYSVVSQEVDHEREITWKKYNRSGSTLGLYRYVINCNVVASNGAVVGSGLGSCSTLESKYVDRPRDLENTVLKMAQKRALVAATLNAFGLSDSFTQDIGDEEDDAHERRPTPQQSGVMDAEEVRPQQQGFDPQNKKHQDWLIGKLREKGVSDDRWDAIALQLRGRPSSDLDTVLARG